MKKFWCPQHDGPPKFIIDTFPARCGDCCKKRGGPGTPDGKCCPDLWVELGLGPIGPNTGPVLFTDHDGVHYVKQHAPGATGVSGETVNVFGGYNFVRVIPDKEQ